MLQLADVEYELQKSAWYANHISDDEYRAAVSDFTERTQSIQKQWKAWTELHQ
jgi:hypothetical protein